MVKPFQTDNSFARRLAATSAKMPKVAIYALLFVFLSIPAAKAQTAHLQDLTINNTRDHLLVFFNVQGAFTKENSEAVLSGVPVTFSYRIQMNQKRNLWFDAKVANRKISQTIEFDPIKKSYKVTRPWRSDPPVVTSSFEEARQLMTRVESLRVIPLKQLEKGKQYNIRVKAELSKTTLPFYLHYILFFVSLWDFETDWQTIDFIF